MELSRYLIWFRNNAFVYAHRTGLTVIGADSGCGWLSPNSSLESCVHFSIMHLGQTQICFSSTSYGFNVSWPTSNACSNLIFEVIVRISSVLPYSDNPKNRKLSKDPVEMFVKLPTFFFPTNNPLSKLLLLWTFIKVMSTHNFLFLKGGNSTKITYWKLLREL